MSELKALDPPYAPSMTLEQCAKRSSALQQTINTGWEFIQFMQKLDSAMRLSFLNYLHTQSNTLTPNQVIPESEIELFSEIKDYTKTLSPKKRRNPSVPKKSIQKPSRVTI